MKYVFSISLLILGLILVAVDMFANNSGGGFGSMISIIALIWIYLITKDKSGKWLKLLLVILALLLIMYLVLFISSGRSIGYGW